MLTLLNQIDLEFDELLPVAASSSRIDGSSWRLCSFLSSWTQIAHVVLLLLLL